MWELLPPNTGKNNSKSRFSQKNFGHPSKKSNFLSTSSPALQTSFGYPLSTTDGTMEEPDKDLLENSR